MPKKQANFNQNKPKNKQVFKKKPQIHKKTSPNWRETPRLTTLPSSDKWSDAIYFLFFFHTCP